MSFGSNRRTVLAGIALSAFVAAAFSFAPLRDIIVQVRDNPHTPTVTIVAWAANQSAYGLRSDVRRNGKLDRDHYFYVDGVLLGQASAPRFVGMLFPKTRNLEGSYNAKDQFACQGQNASQCSPRAYVAARIPDELIRSKPDSLVLRFPSTRTSEEYLDITLRRDVIEAYLAKVDSVMGALATPKPVEKQEGAAFRF